MFADPSKVMSLSEACTKRGFPISCLLVEGHYLKDHANEFMVEYSDHSAHLNPGGEPWCFCSGSVLFSFGAVRKNMHGNWERINRDFAIVADIKTTKHESTLGKSWHSNRIVYKLVESA